MRATCDAPDTGVKIMMTTMKRHLCSRRRSTGVAAWLALWACSSVFAESGPKAPANHTIGYVLTDLMWALYETPGGKTECPRGLNLLGPREQFEILYPKNKKRTLIDTELSSRRQPGFPPLPRRTGSRFTRL